MALRCEFFAPLDIIEELAVEDHEEAAIFVCHRLLTISQSDNAQAPRGEGDARSLEKSLFIWTSMNDRARHPLHHTSWRGSLPDQVDDPCNSAHPAYHRRGCAPEKSGNECREKPVQL
jgi:hypothetical protein